MPIKIFESNNVVDLEEKVNNFIQSKRTLHIHFSSTGEGGAFLTNTKYQVLIEYSDKK